jgi:SAM-dependent methyltransferase
MIDPDAEFLDYQHFKLRSTCPICSERFFRVGSAATIHPNSSCSFTLLGCSGCGHWWHNPLPTQAYLNTCYRQGSLSVVGVGWSADVAKSKAAVLSPNFGHWVLEAEKSMLPGRYLEIGPGNGTLLRAFKQRGCYCLGVEPGGWGRGDENIVEDISQIPMDLKFDVVVALDVLEHVEDPVAMVEHLSQRLVAGGRLYCSFPNSESLRARIFKERWAMVRPIGHLHYFSGTSITHLMSKNHLTVIQRRKHEAWMGLRAIPRALLSFLREFRLGEAIRTLSSAMLSLLAEWLDMGDQWAIISTKEK